jgi:hypothetical protein
MRKLTEGMLAIHETISGINHLLQRAPSQKIPSAAPPTVQTYSRSNAPKDQFHQILHMLQCIRINN